MSEHPDITRARIAVAYEISNVLQCGKEVTRAAAARRRRGLPVDDLRERLALAKQRKRDAETTLSSLIAEKGESGG